MKHAYLIFPVLAVMSMSPKHLLAAEEVKAPAALAAEVKAEAPKFERLQKLISKVDKEKTVKSIDFKEFVAKTEELNNQLIAEMKDFKKSNNDKVVVGAQRKNAEVIAAKIVFLEQGRDLLKSKNEITATDADKTTQNIDGFKAQAEALLQDIEANEVLVAEKAKLDAAPVVAKVEEKKEEVKVEVKEEKKEVAKTEEKKEEKKDKKDEKCESDERYKTLNDQVAKLVLDQSTILQSMMQQQQMNQMMMLSMMQQMSIFQMQHSLANNPVSQPAFQYNQRFVQNQPTYSLYPENFSQPSMMPQPQLLPQNQWMQQPQAQTQQFQLAPIPLQPGQFGGGQAVGFNMNPQIQTGFQGQAFAGYPGNQVPVTFNM